MSPIKMPVAARIRAPCPGTAVRLGGPIVAIVAAVAIHLPADRARVASHGTGNGARGQSLLTQRGV